MAFLEIERKFLVAGDFRREVSGASRIVQGFLNTAPGRTVRVRIRGDRGYLTVKGPSRGLSRFEWEKEIPAAEAEQLLTLCEPGVIDKTRHLVPAADGHVWEVDEFHGDNEGLTVAEIELSTEDEPFMRPAWLGAEVSDDHRYCNSSLTKHPYKEWKQISI
ncbi:MAG: CYTH domain-containing protein [Bacteroidales bacterium]|jgi:adenylate cyclase|nr:CYTH domain-containing protein [Bacteroidales bacterium]